jgi:hypothetical protein
LAIILASPKMTKGIKDFTCFSLALQWIYSITCPKNMVLDLEVPLTYLFNLKYIHPNFTQMWTNLWDSTQSAIVSLWLSSRFIDLKRVKMGYGSFLQSSILDQLSGQLYLFSQ